MDLNLSLITPVVATVAIFAVIALTVMLVRQGRALRRLDERVVDREGLAARASLERLAQLRARPSVGNGRFAPALPAPAANRSRGGRLAGTGLALVAVAGGAAWWISSRGGEETVAPVATPRVTPTGALECPETLPSLARTGFTVAVLNGSGIGGAAGSILAPRLRGIGYIVPSELIKNADRSDIQQSVVMFAPGQKNLACLLMSDLPVKAKLARLDGVRGEGLSGADAAVVVGKDLAIASSQTSASP